MVESKPLCKYCQSENTRMRTYDTLSVDAKAIKETEVICMDCGKKYTL